MAKIQGFVGGLSGKMGSAVFRQSGGQTIVAQYQPVVKNPSTAGQQAQRAKFKLMSQLAAVMGGKKGGKVPLVGFGTMSVNERPARGRMSPRNGFVKANFQLVETVDSDGALTAKIPMEQLQLTPSYRYIPPVVAMSNEPQGITHSVNVTMDAIPSDITSVRLVVVQYRSLPDSNKQPVVMEVIDVDTVDGSIDSDITLPAGETTILAFGMIPTSQDGTAALDNLHTPSGDSYTSAVVLEQRITTGDIATTMTVGVNMTVE